MPVDERLNPASTASDQQIAQLEKRIDDLKQEYILYFNGETRQPPEKKREDLEKAVRRLVFGGAKTARMDLIIQNVAQRFSLYNNLWLKQLNERESGTLPGKKKAAAPPAAPRADKGPREIFLTLNDEATFERFASAYQELLPGGGEEEREQIITSIKAKMVTHNLVEARISVSKQHGKLSIRIKK
ncbi:MAG TPA: hypothetical protein PK919_03450 [Candidatus Aminicenantes bacterium]|nr:hypothetical protein [Candidatus Aminicenantes bacterium]